MRIVIIQGSTRENSQSAKVATRLQEHANSQDIETDIIDLYKEKLPVYDDSGQTEWQSIAQRLHGAEGCILVTPEWNGSASPGMMNFLTFSSTKTNKQLAHRPAVIVSVSSGAGGSYPISQIKAYGNKNNHLVFIPEHLRIRDVKNVLNTVEPETDNEIDAGLHTRISHMVRVLSVYAKALQEIRAAGVIDLETYPNGN